MKIRTKGLLFSSTALGAIALIGLMVWRADQQVRAAEREREHISAIARAINDLRLVTFEYILRRPERAARQEANVAGHLQTLLVDVTAIEREGAARLQDLREGTAASHRLFGDLRAAGTPLEGGADAQTVHRFEAQLASRLLILQQECLADVFRLGDLANARIRGAQRRMTEVTVLGLGLILMATLAGAWMVHRGVLLPITQLEHATREVAAGNWTFRAGLRTRDEIGRMSEHFDAMTQTLRQSFEQIQRKNEELAALNAEIEAFSYSVSHDLRAPLRSMDGFSLALLDDQGERLDEDGRDCLHRIRAASQRMGRLIDELLGLSRVTRAELAIRSVDLSAMARDIAQALHEQEPQRELQWVIDDGITVQADRSLMQIAMQNLLENAWKFTGKTERPVIRIGMVEHDGARDCFVADNGVGFDMGYADRLFGAFQRLHHETDFKGTGIGLAIVQRILRRHEGRIWAHATPGHGATFYFNLEGHGHDRAPQGHPAGGGQPR